MPKTADEPLDPQRAAEMKFFRRQDLADVAQILRVQGKRLDRAWIAQQLELLFGKRDPRVSEFANLCAEVDVTDTR